MHDLNSHFVDEGLSNSPKVIQLESASFEPRSHSTVCALTWTPDEEFASMSKAWMGVSGHEHIHGIAGGHYDWSLVWK